MLYVQAIVWNAQYGVLEQSPLVSYVAADITKLDGALISSMKGVSGAVSTAPTL